MQKCRGFFSAYIILQREESVRSPAMPSESQSSFERFSEYELKYSVSKKQRV